jgi:hypothetical protein
VFNLRTWVNRLSRRATLPLACQRLYLTAMKSIGLMAGVGHQPASPDTTLGAWPALASPSRQSCCWRPIPDDERFWATGVPVKGPLLRIDLQEALSGVGMAAGSEWPERTGHRLAELYLVQMLA